MPDSEPWSFASRGLPLGMCLHQITTRGAYLSPRVVRPVVARRHRMLDVALTPAQARELDRLTAAEIGDRERKLGGAGFPIPHQLRESDQTLNARFDRLVVALASYKRLFGSLDIPQHFAVPNQDRKWPEEVWGLRLGSRVNAVRSQGAFVKNNPVRRELLTEMGFRWETSSGTRQPLSQLAAGSAGGGGGGGRGGGANASLAELLLDAGDWHEWQARHLPPGTEIGHVPARPGPVNFM